jgi:4-diphosphocytidyl-2C-methyl-D-erythritol kinase
MRDVKIPRSLNGTYDYNSLERMLYNDLEHIAIAKKMVLGRIVERLASYLGRKAIVSGSGPSVFCLCRTRKEAMAAKRELFRKTPAGERKSWQVLIAGTKI